MIMIMMIKMRRERVTARGGSKGGGQAGPPPVKILPPNFMIKH